MKIRMRKGSNLKMLGKKKLKGYTLSEILLVLCIIGILLMMAVPNQTVVVSQAKSLEAQNMLNYVYGLQKSYFYRTSKYAKSLDQLGVDPIKTVDQGGRNVYRIVIESATVKGFTAKAISVSDLDSDGQYNTWSINQNNELKELVRE